MSHEGGEMWGFVWGFVWAFESKSRGETHTKCLCRVVPSLWIVPRPAPFSVAMALALFVSARIASTPSLYTFFGGIKDHFLVLEEWNEPVNAPSLESDVVSKNKKTVESPCSLLNIKI